MSNLKQTLMEQWSLIQNLPLLKTIYLKRPIISYKRSKCLKDTLVRSKSNCKAIMRDDRQNHTRSLCRACHSLTLSKFAFIKNGGLLQDRSLGPRYQYFDFYGRSSFPRRSLIPTEEALFYGGSGFLRRKLISTEEAHFYGGSCSLWRKLISTAEADF